MRQISVVSVSLLATFAACLCGSVVTDQTCRITVALVDDSTGRPVAGVVRIRRVEPNESVTPGGAISRGWGLAATTAIAKWFVVPGETELTLPATRLDIEAFSGIETVATRLVVDATEPSARSLRIPIRSFSRVADNGWRAANTHLHLKNLTRAEADRYIRDIPAADRLDVLFTSHLERAGDDASYVSNEYPVGRQSQFAAGVAVEQGEEHRHNFGAQGEGYGHVMLLGLRELVRPVSIGAGISKKPPDAPSIREGIDVAHRQGGTAIWCHNNWGFEDVPNWLSGKLDAQNIFDGGNHAGYAESFYQYLNAGLRVPFSTGTDWFLYDFSRVYARIEGELTAASWLAALRSGRTFITNGPLLSIAVRTRSAKDGGIGASRVGPGGTIALAGPSVLVVEVTARGRAPFGSVELVQNGRVIGSAESRAMLGGYSECAITVNVEAAEPGWLAARVAGNGTNEYGLPLFAHTSAVYFTFRGQSVRIESAVRFLLGELQSARGVIAEQADFQNEDQRRAVLRVYDDAIAELNRTAN